MHLFHNQSFSSKKAVQSYITEQMKLVDYGEAIEHDHPLFSFFMSIVDSHPRKNTGDVIGFIIIRDDYGKKQLWIRDINNTLVCISYRYDKTSSPSWFNDKLNRAFRNSIKEQIKNYKKKWMSEIEEPYCCRICRKTIDIIQADHKDIPFSQIVKLFLDQTTRTIPTGFSQEQYDCSPVFMASDALFEKDWVEFHEKLATYQILCVSCNSSKGIK